MAISAYWPPTEMPKSKYGKLVDRNSDIISLFSFSLVFGSASIRFPAQHAVERVDTFPSGTGLKAGILPSGRKAGAHLCPRHKAVIAFVWGDYFSEKSSSSLLSVLNTLNRDEVPQTSFGVCSLNESTVPVYFTLGSAAFTAAGSVDPAAFSASSAV